MITYRNILVTGGAGFVGSNLACAFKRDCPKARVVALDNLRRRGSELNLPRLRSADVEFHHGDVRNTEDLSDYREIDLLVECSAEPSVLAGFDGQTRSLLGHNLFGAVNCFELAREAGAAVIFLSTSRVYPISPLAGIGCETAGNRLEISDPTGIAGLSAHGVSEAFPLEGARSMYGASKLAGELLLTEYREMFGLKTIVNRCGLIAGPWQMGKSDQGVVTLWVARHIFGLPLSYIGFGGTGHQVRDVLHVDDLYDLLRRQLADMDSVNGVSFNVGGGAEFSVSLKELTALCVEATGQSIDIGSDETNRPADIPYYVSDCRKVTTLTGWRPKRSPAVTVRDIAAWISDNKSLLEPIFNS